MKNRKKSAPTITVLEPTQESSPFPGLLMAVVVASTTGMLLQLAPNIGWPLRITLTAIILLTLKYWGGVLILLAVQLDLFFREPPRSAAFQGPTGILTVVVIVGLLMLISRNRAVLQSFASRPLLSDFTINPGKALQHILRMPGAIVRGAAVLAGCVFVSRLLLSTLPDRRSLDNELRTWLQDEPSVLRCSLLLVGIVAAWIVWGEISWRQLTNAQSELYLRSVFLTIHHADLKMIIRRHLKLRRKAVLEQSDLKTPPGSLSQKNYAGNQK